MMNQYETTIRNRREELARITSDVDRFGLQCRLSRDTVADLQVALSEILTNIVDYGYTDDAEHEITIRLRVIGSVLEAVIEDDGTPFNPLQRDTPDLGVPLEQRRIGGLGIHFVKSLMTDAKYDRVGGRNCLLLRKNLDI